MTTYRHENQHAGGPGKLFVHVLREVYHLLRNTYPLPQTIEGWFIRILARAWLVHIVKAERCIGRRKRWGMSADDRTGSDLAVSRYMEPTREYAKS